MLASITPLGERNRGSNWALTSATYIAAAAAGGAAIGFLVGGAGALLAGTIPASSRLALVTGALLVGFGWEVSGRPLPGPRRQVNEQWLDQYRGWVYGAGFGAQLGTGVTTVVVSSAVYGVLVTAFASASLASGLAVGAGAGALRGISVLAGLSVRSPERLIEFHRSMHRLEAPVRAAGLITQLMLAAVTMAAVAAA